MNTKHEKLVLPIETILEVNNNAARDISEASDDITNAYEEDESDENVDDDGHSASSEEESEHGTHYRIIYGLLSFFMKKNILFTEISPFSTQKSYRRPAPLHGHVFLKKKFPNF